MAFFRKWKTHYKHKKFTSDDAIDAADDCSLDQLKTNKKPKSKSKSKVIEGKKLEKQKSITTASISADDEEDSTDLDESTELPTSTYDLKYLGCTPIEGKRSEKLTSEAIKTVIANSKAGGRKAKSHMRVKLTISPEGIEVRDQQAETKLLQYSIYKISYCSVDAAHDHAFSFVGSEADPLDVHKERLSCHVFLCAKRKLAHEITLMVARCFENAYQQWRELVIRQAEREGMTVNKPADMRQVLKQQNGDNMANQQQTQNGLEEQKNGDALLIDLAASDFVGNDMRRYLQNSWVSFEDDPHEARGAQLVY